MNTRRCCYVPIISLVFIIIGLMMIISHKTIHEIIESWKNSAPGEPSKLFEMSTRFGGVMLVGIAAIVVEFLWWIVIVNSDLGYLNRMNESYNDGTPCAGKLACTVWRGGKPGEYGRKVPVSKGYLSR